jgi:hypothetical protein
VTTAAEKHLQTVSDESAPQTGSPLSVLGNLKSRREDIKQGEHIDLPVPRWDTPRLVVRYGPIDHDSFKRMSGMIDRAPDKVRSKAEVDGNCDILIKACKGVYAVVNGERYSLRTGDHEGEWTKFDDDLADNLGCGHSAREVVKALYITDGDILSTASKIAEFSGYREQEADDSIVGE